MNRRDFIRSAFAALTLSPLAKLLDVKPILAKARLPKRVGSIIFVYPGDDLKAAMDMAEEGDTVRVFRGTYEIDGPFEPKSGVAVFGDKRKPEILVKNSTCSISVSRGAGNFEIRNLHFVSDGSTVDIGKLYG